MPDHRRPLTGSPRPASFKPASAVVPPPVRREPPAPPPAAAQKPAAPPPPKPAAQKSARKPAAPDPVLLDHDLACAVLAGIAEGGGITVTADAITVPDPATRTPRTQANWLRPNDLLGVLCRQLVAARQRLTTAAPRPGQAGWEAAKVIRAREEAVADARELKARIREMLDARDTLALATRHGLRVMAD